MNSESIVEFKNNPKAHAFRSFFFSFLSDANRHYPAEAIECRYYLIFFVNLNFQFQYYQVPNLIFFFLLSFLLFVKSCVSFYSIPSMITINLIFFRWSSVSNFIQQTIGNKLAGDTLSLIVLPAEDELEQKEKNSELIPRFSLSFFWQSLASIRRHYHRLCG